MRINNFLRMALMASFLTPCWLAAQEPGPQGVAPGRFPPAGLDEFPVSLAQIGIDLDLDGAPEGEISVEGPFRVSRSDPRPGTDGGNVIDVEIVALELVGSSPLGPVTVRQSRARRSQGQIQARSPENDFPADSFFDVFVELEIGGQTLTNREPIHLEAVITEIPPRITVYRSLKRPVIPLFRGETNQLVALLLHVAHAPNPNFDITPRDLKILIERVQLKVDLVSTKLDLLTRTPKLGLQSLLFFTFNVSGGGLETGIAITNITNQFVGLGGQAVGGTILFQLIPAANPQAAFTVSSVDLAAAGLGSGLGANGVLASGGTLSVLVGELLRAADREGPFSGQIFARCGFPGAQGINFIADSAFSNQAQGYPAVVIQ